MKMMKIILCSKICLRGVDVRSLVSAMRNRPHLQKLLWTQYLSSRSPFLLSVSVALSVTVEMFGDAITMKALIEVDNLYAFSTTGKAEA